MRCNRSRTPIRSAPAARAVLLGLLASFATSSGSSAQSADQPLSDCDYRLDLVTGPVLGSGRVVGLGGAYTALAAGIEGAAWNPASYASRTPWDYDWFEWNGTLDLAPSTIRNSDFDNNGQAGVTYGDLLSANVGLGLQFGAFGVGAAFNVQTYDIRQNVGLELILHNYGAGYMFAQGQLVLGLGLRAAQLEMTAGTNMRLVDITALGPEVGALLKPDGRRWRIGVAARLPAESQRLPGCVAAGLFLPRHVYLPWQIQIGVAFQLGPRPLNRSWINPHTQADRLREAMLSRRRRRAEEQFRRETLAERMSRARERLPPRVVELDPEPRVATHAGDVPRDATWRREEAQRRLDEERELTSHIAELEAELRREVRALSRRYLLLSAEAIVIGVTSNGVGLESFLSQTRQDAGRDLSVGLRLGIEGEPIANWLQMRAGTYLEPSRFRGVGYRAHATLGIDVRLFSWDLFGLLDEFTTRIGASADVAERYLNAGFGIGLWH